MSVTLPIDPKCFAASAVAARAAGLPSALLVVASASGLCPTLLAPVLAAGASMPVGATTVLPPVAGWIPRAGCWLPSWCPGPVGVGLAALAAGRCLFPLAVGFAPGLCPVPLAPVLAVQLTNATFRRARYFPSKRWFSPGRISHYLISYNKPNFIETILILF